MRKYDFFKGQYPSEVEFDQQQENFDDGIKDFLLAHSYQGIVAGLVATASPGAPTFDLVITAGTAYDKDGEHCYVATDQTIDVSKDELGNTTYTDIGVGEFRWVSIFLHFDRALSDPRIDDDKKPLHFIHAESYTIRVVNGTKGLPAVITEPALDANDILLADLYMYNGMADVVAGDIHVHRREEVGYYRSSTGGIVKHKNDTMLGPDKDCIEETLDDDIAISGYRKYGNRFVEYRDRQHVRITSRLAEFNDDFNTSALVNWWAGTVPVPGITEGAATNITWGAYSVRIDNGNNGEWLLRGTGIWLALMDQPVFETALKCDAADGEHALYFGVEVAVAANHTHTEEGWGFYHNNGNWFAVNHDGVGATATDTGVAVNATRFEHFRVHIVCDTAGLVTKILFYIDDALVATHTTNMPGTIPPAFMPFVSYKTTAGPQTAHKTLYLDRFFVGGMRKSNHE